MQGHLGDKAGLLCSFPPFTVALVMQPLSFLSGYCTVFSLHLLIFSTYVLRAYFGQVLCKKWIKTIMLSVSMEYKILVREIEH